MTKMKIRKFQESDIDCLISILISNGQYTYPEIEGAESMKRVVNCNAAVFLVATIDDNPCGFIKAVYDGSRALIHLLSVHPNFKGQSIGTALVSAVKNELREKGANTFSVTVTDSSIDFWKKQGFHKIPVFLMLDDGDSTPQK
jgi:ribosomal protein S18 acetylase RimI-like enzyme